LDSRNFILPDTWAKIASLASVSRNPLRRERLDSCEWRQLGFRMHSEEQFPPPERQNGAEIKVSAPCNFLDSESFKHVRHQRPRKVAAEPVKGRRVFLQKRRKVGSGLILLTEDVVLVLIEDFAIASIQRD
jgi:hypothetical protein